MMLDSKIKMIISSSIFLLSASHALIDAACAFSIFFLLKQDGIVKENFFILVVIYNILAFGLEVPLGMIADKFKISVKFAALGCITVAIAIFFTDFTALATVFLAGIGNALFHVGGGIVALNLKPKKATVPGIFVAPGALGLLMGTIIGKEMSFTFWPFVVLLIAAAILIMLIKKPEINYNQDIKNKTNYAELVVILILLSVAIRSLVGLALIYPWKQDINLLIIFTLFVFLGKALGGIIGDRFGWMRVSVISLLISAPLLTLGSSSVLCRMIGIFLFNMTMPITLTAISNLLPGRAGLSFGLTTLALLVGALITFTPLKNFFSLQWMIFTVTIISLIVLYKGLKMYFLTEKYAD